MPLSAGLGSAALAPRGNASEPRPAARPATTLRRFGSCESWPLRDLLMSSPAIFAEHGVERLAADVDVILRALPRLRRFALAHRVGQRLQLVEVAQFGLHHFRQQAPDLAIGLVH